MEQHMGLQNLCRSVMTFAQFDAFFFQDCWPNYFKNLLASLKFYILAKMKMGNSMMICQFRQLPWHCRPIQEHHLLETAR